MKRKGITCKKRIHPEDISLQMKKAQKKE
jgi:hypothetical protein